MRWFLACMCAFLLFLGATTLEIATTDGHSMSPSLSDGDAVVLVKTDVLVWLGRSFQHGDVIVVDVWDQRYVKRIAALDSQYIEMSAGEVVTARSFNDRSQERDTRTEGRLSQATDCDVGEPPGNWHWSFVPREIASGQYEPTSCNWGPVVVPESQFFVLGDHAVQSNDSRSFGFVKREMIKGLVIWNISRGTTVERKHHRVAR